MSAVQLDPLDILEGQIIKLERKIIGNAQLSDKDETVANSLAYSSVALENSVSTYDSIPAVFKRIHELGTYLDPSHEDSIADTAMKAKLVFESESDIRIILDQLNKMNTINENLRTELFQDLPNQMNQLRKQSERIVWALKEFQGVEVRTKRLSEDFYKAMITFDQARNLLVTLLNELDEGSVPNKLDSDV